MLDFANLQLTAFIPHLNMSITSAPSIDKLDSTRWTNPSFTLPTPSLEFLFHLECDMESFKHIGPGPHGHRATVIFKGGRFEGPKLRGAILPGGGGGVPSPTFSYSG